MTILLNAEKQGELAQLGGWQKEMARRRYQKGNIRRRGNRNPVWELQWWEDYLNPDGTIGRRRQSAILGNVSEMTRRQAFKAAEEMLRPLNQGQLLPHSTLTFGAFVEQHFVPYLFPTLKASTQKRYRQTFHSHLLPAFQKHRLCDMTTFDIQRFVLEKMESGLGWESAQHYRNLISKVFTVAKKWGFYSGDNPANGVTLPEKQPVREKHILQPKQISALLIALKEPVRTMVLLGVLTGLRIGEILGLSWKSLDSTSGQLRVEQALYRGTLGTPKTKRSRRTVPLPQSLVVSLTRLKAQRRTANSDDDLVFLTRNGTPYSDTNLLHQHLKPAGPEAWSTLAELARAPAHPRHSVPGSGRIVTGCTSSARPLEDVHYPRNLHLTDSRKSAGSGRNAFANGDEW